MEAENIMFWEIKLTLLSQMSMLEHSCVQGSLLSHLGKFKTKNIVLHLVMIMSIMKDWF